MKHGPIALIDENMATVMLLPRGPGYPKALGNLQEIKARDGFVILRNAVQAETCDELLSQLQPHIDATAYATDDGLGKTTRRTGAVVARAPASWELAAHPMLCV